MHKFAVGWEVMLPLKGNCEVTMNNKTDTNIDTANSPKDISERDTVIMSVTKDKKTQEDDKFKPLSAED